jgi:HAE1 family hydrophobic/amphiphilic exporter-1
MGQGGEFYRPLAVAIIGGTITSTILTLLVIPSFYDSIELMRDHLFEKFGRRSQARGVAWAVVVTGLEILATLVMLRMVWRMVVGALRRLRGRALTAA